MDLLKAQLDRLQKQLSGLTSSQKMLTAALVAIMVMTLIWWGKYAGEPEMTPMLDQSFSQEDTARITADLATRGIHYSISGDRIYIPADRKFEVLAALSYGHLLPRNTETGFDQMVKQMNPLQPDSTIDRMFNRGKEMMLSQIIQEFPGVANAEVLIDPSHERLVEGSVDPSATVTISMQDGQTAGQQLVDAAADVVQGAQSGLARNHIKVVVGGIPRRVHDTDNPDDADGSDTLELSQKASVATENRIKDYLSYIPGLKVFVTVKVNSTSIQEQRRDFDGKKAVQKESQTTSDTINSTGGAGGGGEPGVVPNAPLAIDNAAPSAGTGSSSSEDKESASYQNFVPEVNTVSKTPAGDVSVIAATVRVPEAYFAAIYTQRDPNARNPTEDQLKPLIDAELPKIQTDVMKCTGLTTEKDVAVETYVDPTPIAPPAPALAGVSSVTSVLGGHSKELGLGALAVMSLFMVSMMVRKSAPPLAIADAGTTVGTPTTLDAAEAVAGEVGGAASPLDGMELDEEAVRSQQMLDQVSNMVKENPDAAATLVKRWLNRS